MPARPKQPLNARTVLPSGRTPYEDAKAMLTCFHEAGHLVVGHAIGWELKRAAAGRGFSRASFEPVSVPNLLEARSKREMNTRIRGLRDAMTMVAAGPVAETIHQTAVQEQGFESRYASRAYGTWWAIRVSALFPNSPDQDPDSDYALLVRDASRIAHVVNPPVVSAADLKAENMAAMLETLNRHAEEATRAELLAAEAKAERILKKQWAAVEAIALALHKSKSGRLNRKQLLAHIERHAK